MIFLMNNKNIFAKISILCIIIITSIITLNSKFNIIQINPVALILYMLILLFTSIWINFSILQMILNENTPFDLTSNNLYTKIINGILQFFPHDTFRFQFVIPPIPMENIDERIDLFVSDIEKLFIRKWYKLYISADETFLLETRNLLDIIVRRFLQIAPQINSDKIIHGVFIILLKHVKEYRKAVKKAKNFGGSVETQYRYSHVASKSPVAIEHFTLQLTTKLSRHFINWELYNSLACKCIISILAKRLVTLLLVHTSSPGFLNYKILSKTASIENKKNITFDKHSFVSVSNVDHSKVMKEIIETISEEKCILEESCTPKKDNLNSCIDSIDGVSPKENFKACIDFIDGVLPKILENEIGNNELNVTVATNESTTPIFSKVTDISERVKVHESRSSNKTWRNSRDLDCISLGHDILYLSDMSDSDKKPWKDSLEAEEVKTLPVLKEIIHEEVDNHGLFGEHHRMQTGMSNIQNFLRPATTGAATLITNTIKPLGNATANTMKELQQSTVNNVVKPVSQVTCNAMHKIGDLQDEAAGMVEGIFDFGMAGLRKGLQLTGLQDNIHDSMPVRSRAESDKRDIPVKNGKQRLAKMTHVNSDDIKIEEVRKEDVFDDNVWVNPLLLTDGNISPSFEGDILLEKSPMDSKSLSRESTKSSEIIPTLEVESPEIEYEDTPDLATTTAKLRSLLAQKTSESAISTPISSPMSMIPTPIDPTCGEIEEYSEVDSALPSMYKAFAKTASGVFQNTLNTIKTALPGNTGELDLQNTQQLASRPTGFDTDDRSWLFVQSDPQPTDLSTHMEKFLNERRVFCTIDNAYEAIEAVELGDRLDSSLLMRQRQFDDELDDFDTKIPMTKALVDLICELVEDTYPSLVKENIIKIVLLTSGKSIEGHLHELGEKLLKSINLFIGGLPKFEDNPLTMPMKIEAMVDLVIDSVPSVLTNIMNKDCIKSIIRLFLESLQSQKINQDTNLQLMDLLAFEIITSAGQSSPTYSA